MGGDVAGEGYPGSPGSGGASPYLRRGSPPSGHMPMVAQVVIDANG
jgi:hypothetical protein